MKASAQETKQSLEIKLDQFQGPLDLLLHLIKQLEVDIYDIPIAEVTQQYLAYLKEMEEAQLYVAGEFIVMASTLMAIKSKYLLPRYEEQAESDLPDEDPRDYLKDLLIEYQFFKELAAHLDEKNHWQKQHFTKPPADLKVDSERALLDEESLQADRLSRAFQAVIKRFQLLHPADQVIPIETLSIEDKRTELLTTLKNSPQRVQDFMACIDSHTKAHLVVSFLALLELIKNKEVRADQKDGDSPILICLVEEDEN